MRSAWSRPVRMALTAAAGCFLLGAAPAAQAPEEAARREASPREPTAQEKVVAFLEAERDVIDPLKERTASLLEESAALRREYEAAWIPSRELLTKREAKRRELADAFREYRRHLSDFRSRLDEYEQLSFVSAFGRFMKGEASLKKVSDKLTDPGSARTYSRGHEPFLAKYSKDLAEEQAAFEAVLRSRRRRIGGVWAGGVLLLSAVVFFIKRRIAPGTSVLPRGGR